MKKQKKLVGRRLLALLLTLTMLLGMIPVTAFGTEDLIEISDANGLRAMASKGGSYQLTADVELPNDWTSIVSANNVTLDGNGYTITLSGQPLFKTLYGNDIVKNLILDGKVEGSSHIGSLAVGCAGTVQNCISYADVTYVGAGGGTWSPHHAAGLLAYLSNKNAQINNCVYAGTITPGNAEAYGAIADYYYVTASIKNSVGVGSDRIGMNEGWDLTVIETGNNTLISSKDEFVPADYVEQMNINIQEGDLTWILKDDKLGLQSVVVPDATREEIDSLTETLKSAEKVNTKKIYTSGTWKAFSEALNRAEGVASKTGTLKQREVVNATKGLINAIEALEERSFSTVEITSETAISITTADELEYMQDGCYYRLDADITLGEYWFGYFNTMNSVLDGNGHTIKSIGKPLWAEIGPNGVVQNVGLEGPVQNQQKNTGAFAENCSGLIINCWTKTDVTAAEGKTVGGFVANLKSGGAIINSYAAGTITSSGTTGALAGTTEENSLIRNGYWLNTLASSAAGSAEGVVEGSAAKLRKDFYSEDFLEILNEGKGTYGMEWNLSSDGYPYFGEAKEYVPDAPLEITYTPSNGEAVVTFSSIDGLTVSLADISSSANYMIGTLSAENAAHWTITYKDSTVQKPALVADETGELYIYLEGTVEVIVSDSNWNILGKFPLTVTTAEAEGLRFSIDGEPIGEDGLILKGSEIVTLVPEIMQNGQWKSVASSTLQFTEIGKLHRNGSTIYAEEPGVMTLTASGFGQETSIEITSEYVPVKAIRPAANGIYAVHGRNANSTGSGDFLDLTLSHGAGNVIVEPSNASYRNQWTIESSDPEIAEYMPSSIVAVLPKKAGTVTLTAISGDPRLTEPVTGTSVITIEYKNPIVDVFVLEEEIQINKNETRELPLAYMGTRDDCEYITEPEVDWNFETSDGGEVEIGRSSLGILTGSTNPDEYCMANTKYQITGVAEGTVTVTGIALDQTNELQPITFRVVVGEGAEETPVDSLQTAKDGIKDAQNYLLNNMGSGYTYGYEWEVLSLTRSGKSVETANYLSSVETKYTSRLEEFGLDTKPTTMARVAVALGTIGEDASDFRGIDFIDMICNTDRITEGGNEPMWALIALDSRDYPVPEGAKWTREKLVSEILSKYQNTQTGAFGLNDNVSTSIDMTAMALQALVPYVDQRKDVADAVDKALEYLKSEMNRDAGYGGTVESAAQVLTALTALDIDAADVETGFAKSVARNLITNIMSFKVEDGEGFKHQADDKTAQNMSSIQALYSLESYRRFAENENAFFDLTDVNMRGLLQSKIDDAESLTEDDYTEESWNALQSVLEEAKAVVGDSSSTDEELKNAADAVAAAIAALEAAKSEGGSVAPEVKTITVKFRLVGDTKHEAAEDHNGYVNWIKTFNVTIPEDGTVYDAFVAALDKKGMDFEEGQHSYISSIKAPAAAGGYWLGEYDNGPYSGWKYIVNGEYPNVGLRYYWLEDGDSIVWRYVDDYTDREDATDKWEEAADVVPTKPSSNVTDSKEEEQKPSASLTPEASTNSKGEASVEIKKDELTSAVEEATKDNTAGTVVIAPEIKGDASKVTVELPKEAVDSMATTGKTDLTVKTDIATVTLPAETLKELPTDGKTVSVAVETVKGDATAEAGSTAAADKIVVEVAVDNKAVDKIGSGVVASIPAKEASATSVLVIVDAEGNETIVKKSAVADGEITALLEGSCTVVVKDNKKEFTDTEGHWGKSAAEFASSRELFNGVGNGQFGMNTTMNRAMMATVFYNLENGPEHDGEHDFHDVDDNRYYAKPVAWAAESGVLSGYNDGSFRADAPVTREQLAVMLWNYSGKPSGIKALEHSDAGNISNYAKEAMQWAVENGVMSGRANGQLDPKGAATRAEVAQMFKNYIEKVVL